MFLNKLISGVLLFALTIPVTAMAGRQEAELPEFASEHLMKVMRNHLGALEDITRLLSQHQYEKAANIAEESLGMSSVEIHFKKHVGKYLPKDMRVLAENMHEAATRFATDARNAAKEAELDKTLSSLSNVIEQCVACHAVYRVHQSGR